MSLRSLAKTVPGARLLVRGLRRLLRPAGTHRYWESRKRLQYYQDVLRLARRHAPDARSVIDVGSKSIPFVRQLDWIPQKVTLDLRPRAPVRGCTNLTGDFMTMTFAEPFDLVLCLQVLEHLQDPAAFTRRLLATGRTVIISVPYRWRQGLEASHVQDPVDETKLLGWTARPWVEHTIAREHSGVERLVVVVPGDVPPRPGAGRPTTTGM